MSDEPISFPATVEDNGDHYMVSFPASIRGMEGLSEEQVLELLRPGQVLELAPDGVFGVVGPDES